MQTREVGKEFIAGLSVFLSVVYIIPLNAAIMSNSGMPYDSLVLATALVSAAATLFCGIFSNTPIIISVAMGLNAYFTFDVVLARHIPWQSALGAVFFSGLIFFILSFTRFRQACMEAIPADIKRAIGAGIGLFITFIGLSSLGIIIPSKDTMLTLGNLSKPESAMGVLTLILLLFFWVKKIKAGFLLAIILSSLISWGSGISPYPKEFFSLPDFTNDLGKIAFSIDLKAACSLAMLPIILSFLITQLFDSLGLISSVGVKEGLFKGIKGDKKLGRVMIADASGSLLGATLGTTTVTTLVESQISVQSGARTGLSAVVCGCGFVLCVFMIPLFKQLPSSAIYPMLIMIGVMMFDEVGKIDYKDPAIGVSSFFIIILMPLTYSMTLGFSLGFLLFIIMCILNKQFKRLNKGVLGLGFISLLVLVLNIWQF